MGRGVSGREAGQTRGRLGLGRRPMTIESMGKRVVSETV